MQYLGEVMKCFKYKLRSIALVSMLMGHSYAFAEEDYGDKQDHSGGFLKIGLGYKFEQNPYEDEKSGLALFLNGRYQMDMGLFIEASSGINQRQDGISIGYNFYNTQDWSFDITTVKAFGETKVVGEFLEPGSLEAPTIVIDKRGSSEMLGLRATGTFGNTNLQFLAAPLLLNDDYDDGVYASFWLGRSWQIKNWEFYASAGLEYRSKEILAHYFEPSAALIDAGVPSYNSGSGVDYTFQVSATYPISENLIFESYSRYKDISNSITESPVIAATSQLNGRDEAETEFGILVSYVF
jgi:outer membrane scaffolding protein for murein synthesis (MipA/OmpV family)